MPVAPSLSVRVRSLGELSVPELRRRYTALTGRSTKTDNRPWLVRVLAEHMTEGQRVEGRNARRALARALQSALAPRTKPDVVNDPRIPPIGSVLKRRHGDRLIEVKVTRKGFRFQGRLYRSLSAVAREATGSHWNGLLWFGLTPRSRDRRPS